MKTKRPKKVKEKKNSLNPDFAESRKKELMGLLEEGTLERTDRRNLPAGTRVFGSRFIDEIKKAGERLRRKSRLVAQNYCDEDAGNIPKKAPTIQRFSQHILLVLAASIPTIEVFSRDVTQAYIQSTKPLRRPVYIEAPL